MMKLKAHEIQKTLATIQFRNH